MSRSSVNWVETKQHASLTSFMMYVSSIMFHCRNETSSFRWFVRSFPPTSMLIAPREVGQAWHRQRPAHRLTASHTIDPLIMGTTCVKLKPASTTMTHSGFGRPSSWNSLLYGMTAAAGAA